jgi:hypothetical protein
LIGLAWQTTAPRRLRDLRRGLTYLPIGSGPWRSLSPADTCQPEQPATRSICPAALRPVSPLTLVERRTCRSTSTAYMTCRQALYWLARRVSRWLLATMFCTVGLESIWASR